LAQLAAQNPQVQQLLQFMKSGGNLQALCQNMAKQKGIDPNWLINKLLN